MEDVNVRLGGPARTVLAVVMDATVTPRPGPMAAGAGGEVRSVFVGRARCSAPAVRRWELGRFCALALEGEPEALESLWSPRVLRATGPGLDLLELRSAFLSTRVRDTYLERAGEGFARLGTPQDTTFGPAQWARTAGLLRLLLSGRHLLAYGEPMLEPGIYRERLDAVRRGAAPWPAVRAWRQALIGSIDDEAPCSRLPRHPDDATITALLTRARHRPAA